MNVFDLHDRIVSDYASYIRSFINIADPAIRMKVDSALSEGKLWPDPLLQFNPAYEQAGSIEDIAQKDKLHHALPNIFKGYSLYSHQLAAIRLGVAGKDFVVTSGTGSGKSLTYIGSIFNQLLAESKTEGVSAVIVYPMNALINSQTNEFNIYKKNYEDATGHQNLKTTLEIYAKSMPADRLNAQGMFLELLFSHRRTELIGSALVGQDQ
jgi:ATP-dependent helicase YprA (DUF1998 family)